MRLSGFLKGTTNAPNDLMNTRMAGRILFFGFTRDDLIAAWASGPDSALARELGPHQLEKLGVFKVLGVATGGTPKERLLAELRRIHLRGGTNGRL